MNHAAALVLALAPAVPGDALAPGTWRAWLESPGGELPFGMEVAAESDEPVVHLVNGAERIRVPRVEVAEGEVVLAMEHYDATIRARLSEDGARLEGEWTKRTGPDASARLPFHATRGEAPRFDPIASARAGAPPEAVTGRWSVRFASSEDPAVGVFDVDEDRTARGTFLTTTGDYRFLAGSFEADVLRLSCFDGAHAFLFRATLREDGTLAGEFWSRDASHDTWTAERDDDATLPDAFAETTWDEGFALGELELPDLDGRPRNLADPELLGEATLVQVFGSWCPNCHDETAYLKELHERYGERGLAIVGIAFELTGDCERDARQVREYRRRHDVAWPILLGGTADKARASAAIPGLDRVRSYPTTIFLDRCGEVEWVHSGFSGPATGEAHESVRRDFEERIEVLLDPARRCDHRGSWWYAAAFRHWGGEAVHEITPDATIRWDLVPPASRHAPILVVNASGGEGAGPPIPLTFVGRNLRFGARTYCADPGGAWRDPADLDRRIVLDRDRPVPFLESMGFPGPLVADPASRPVSQRHFALMRDRYEVPVTATLLEALRAGSPLVRRESLTALVFGLGGEPLRSVPEEVLRDEDLRVRATAAWAAGRIGDEAATPALLENLDHPYAALRRESARALHRIGSGGPAVAEALAALAADCDPLVRAAAAGERW